MRRSIPSVLTAACILLWSATGFSAEKIAQGRYAADLANRLSFCAAGAGNAASGTGGGGSPLSPVPNEDVQTCMASLEEQAGGPPPWPSTCRALEACIGDLAALGIQPPGGWNPVKTLTDDDISDLAEDVILASKQGKIECEPQDSVKVLAAATVAGGYSSRNVYATAYRELDYYFPPVLDGHLTTGGGGRVGQTEENTISTNQ